MLTKYKVCFLFLCLITALSACVPANAHQIPVPSTPTSIPTPIPMIDADELLENGLLEIREERTYIIELKFYKEQLTLNLWELAKNEAAAEYKTVIVDENTYNSYAIGSVVSSKSDGLAFIFNGDLFVQYKVTVHNMETIVQHYYITGNSTEEILPEQYSTLLAHLKKYSGLSLITVPYSGYTRTYVLTVPLKELVITSEKQMQRYYLRVEVQNETFTLDLGKHLRNAANRHTFVVEVPEDDYNNSGEFWNPNINVGSFLLKGHISTLHGVVTEKWTENDSRFRIVQTADGRELVLPK